VSGDRLLRDIREMRASFAAKYGRPMNSDEIRTLELAERLARSMREPVTASLQAPWPSQCDARTNEELLVCHAEGLVSAWE
jgi:hypothetical protein